MRTTLLKIAAFSMALCVIAGALGAHALEAVLSPDQLDSFTTGVRYQAWHSLALILLQIIPESFLPNRTRKICSYLFISGIVFFSFSIYLLSLRDVLNLGNLTSVIGPITPLGGLLFIGAWITLAFGITSKKVQ